MQTHLKSTKAAEQCVLLQDLLFNLLIILCFVCTNDSQRENTRESKKRVEYWNLAKKHLVHYSTLLSSHHTELSYSGTCCCLKWETYKLEINSGYSHMCTMCRGFTFVQFCSLLAWCLFEFQPWHDKLSPEQLCILMSVQPTHTHTYMLLM